ncbi:MAG: DUF1800 family protein [Burkholderiales bacterium]|nr:DUF1800 family protein [Burkholderiales bacterium]
MQGDTRIGQPGSTQSRGWRNSFFLATVLLAGAWVGNAAAQFTINAPPAVSLSAEQTSLKMGASTKVTAVATDRDGTIQRILIYDGVALLGQGTSSPFTLDYTPTAVGSRTLTAVAVDNRLAQVTSQPVTIVVTSAGNQPPTVSLSASPPVISSGGSSTLTAQPADADGSVAMVMFYEGAKLIGTATSAPWQVTFVDPNAGGNGVHYVTAVAYDNLNAQTTSNAVMIYVSTNPNAGTNKPPQVALASSATTLTVGQSATLTAAASDSDGTVSKVDFYNGAALAGSDTSNPYGHTFTPAAAGTFTFTAQAFDNAGASTTSNAVTIQVSANPGGNQPPSVSLSSSAMTLTVGQSATLTAAASDSDGTVSKVDFYNGAALAGSDTSNPYNYTFTPTAAGTFNFTARAFDNASASTTSNAVAIVVTSGGQPAPTNLPRITLSMSANVVAPGATVTLNGTAAATAAGASVQQVSFYISGQPQVDDTTSPYSTTFTPPGPGTYNIYAGVRDSLGNTNTTLVQKVIVQNAPAVVTTDPDIYRLLNQATFGFSQAEAANVQRLGIEGWIDDQMSPTKPVSGYPDSKYNRIQLSTSADCTTQAPGGMSYPADSPQAICARDHLTLAMVQRDFFTNAIYAPDQLRQRVAWALSQILVTSGNEPDLSYAHVMSRYQNLMFEEAFGNYETLLRKVTYNAAMGNYLDAVNNDRAPAPPTTSTRVPNENYAREIMQLFSVGLHELNLDGTPIMDPQTGMPVPTYGQTEIAEFARVFTGYTYSSAANPGGPATGKQGRYYGAPMVPYPTTNTTGHDPNAKTLLNGTILPAGQTGQQDIDAAVRNVFSHSNTAPFVAKQLIQRLVTGNPSPAYVARIAAVFEDNDPSAAVGQRGDLKAVVRAILLDPEARGGVKSASDFGSLREPVLMVTSLLRATNGHTDGNRLEGQTGNLGQRPYYSPSVFNYFMPDAKVPNSVPPITGPEFGIHTTVTAIGRANLIYALVYGGYAPDPNIPNAVGTRVFLGPFEALADDPAAMVSLVNQQIAGGQFPAALEATIVTAVNAITMSATPTAAERLARARMAVYLMASSYDYQVQR